MKMPAATWPMIYWSSRRKHNHRCQCCRKIIAEGDEVLMAKVVGKASRCVHVACASRPYPTQDSPLTWRDALEGWGMEYLAACGWPEAKDFIETAPIFKPAGVSAA